MMIVLKAGVVAAALYAVIALIYLLRKAAAFGSPIFYSKEKGSRIKGIMYAFGRGMMPWEKESAGKHLLSYLAGVTYHAGIFIALLSLRFVLWVVVLPSAILLLCQIILLAGGSCGAGLLVKRISSAEMKVISCLDDYVANIIVDLFIFSALLHSFLFASTPVFYGIAIVMFLYIPVGKIRHCFFFFLTRILFGIFFGRRDVFPGATGTGHPGETR